jgi:hypothetical protein
MIPGRLKMKAPGQKMAPQHPASVTAARVRSFKRFVLNLDGVAKN